MASQAKPANSGSRQIWGSQMGFILAAIGSAVGLGNIWRFPGVAYSNGGGAFLIPYLVALICAGIPILFLDYAMGHRFRGSAPLAFRRLSKKLEFLGWWQVLVCFVIMVYYAVIIGWACMYIFYSVGSQWGSDPAKFFTGEYLQVQGQGVSFLPIVHVAIPLVLVWVFSLVVLSQGVRKGLETASKIFIPLLAALFIMLVIRALFLPGALDGLNAFFTPNWAALADHKVWLAAFAQIFFSMSVGFGILLTYASYLRKNSNLTSTGLVTGFANSAFEILAGIGVFSALGFMAHGQHTTIDKLEGISGVSLSFITFPKIISEMPGGSLFGVLFFSSLAIAGITSLMSLLQVVTGAFEDKFNLTPRQSTVIVGIPATIISVLLFSTATGLNVLDVVDKFINEIGVVGSAAAMTLAVAVVARKLPTMRKHLNKYSAIKVPKIWTPLVGFIIPAVLLMMGATTAIDLVKNGYGEYAPDFVAIFGWGSLAFAAIMTAVMTVMPWRINVNEFDADIEHDLEEEPVEVTK